MNRYLQKALDLKAKVGLDSLIYTDGVAERSFNFEDLNTLILNHIGVEKYYIHCKFLNGVQYLDTIEICLDLSYNYIDCPTSTVACKNTADVVVPQLAI